MTEQSNNPKRFILIRLYIITSLLIITIIAHKIGTVALSKDALIFLAWLIIFSYFLIFAILYFVKRIKNFFDRITLKYIINPLDEGETKDMIGFRLKQAGYNGGSELFSDGAVKLIHEHTMGYPRKIAVLCHNALEELVMRDRHIVDESLMSDVIGNEVI